MTVFVDAGVIMYAGGREHPLRDPCRAVLGHIGSGRLSAVTSAEVVQEIFHRFTALRRPHIAAEMASACLDLFSPVLPVTHAVMSRMPDLVRRYGDMAARDLVHVATCAEEQLSAILSPDRDFDRVREVKRIAPDNTEALRQHLR